MRHPLERGEDLTGLDATRTNSDNHKWGLKRAIRQSGRDLGKIRCDNVSQSENHVLVECEYLGIRFIAV